MFDAVSSTVIPKLQLVINSGTISVLYVKQRNEPEHIRGFTVAPLQYLRC